MDFRILGPLEVVDGDRRIEIKAPKQRLVLTVLALAAGGEVSSDRLVEDVWGDEPPQSGLSTLRYHVSKLRDTLQPDRKGGEESVIVTRPSGYALLVAPDEVDAVRFGRIVQDARRLLEFDPSQAAARLREALALWRGPLSAELFGMSISGFEARRLTELRLTALEDRFNADLATGHHAEVVPELEALVGEHPLRERLWAQLMVALYRSDRQAEALRAYQRLRSILGEELGIEPSPDLRRLEEMILLQVPDLDVPEGLRRPASLRGYEMEEGIGEGAFGMVWRAAQRSIDREVAIKVVRPEFSNRPGFVLGFQAEAQRLAMLEHPHIVPVYDFWRDPDGAYLVMQLMAAGSLAERDVPFEVAGAVRVVEQVGSALAYAHRLGMAHGDLHPGNVLFDGSGNGYLADFGLASFLSGGSSTPPEAFASPEQLRGEPPGPESDVFSFGRLAFTVLTGEDPGTGSLPRASVLRTGLPAGVDGVLRRATDPDPGRRQRDAGELVDELLEALGEAPAVVAERNPYKGLRAFGEADAADFFGRTRQTEELLEAVAGQRLVTVVGPSGCGKSSLVAAGLVPALRAGGLPGSEQWLVTTMVPGAAPFDALVQGLRSVATRPVPDGSDPVWERGRAAGIVAGVVPGGSELALVVDQLEEVFTAGSGEGETARFLDVLADLAATDELAVRVVTVLRADFFGEVLEHRSFAGVMRDGVVSVTSPGSAELRDAVTGPAAAAGLDVEPELVAQVVADTMAEPGGLPLLEYALTQLAADPADGRLTLGAYREIGGIAGALGTWPERLHADLDGPGRQACRQVFLRLVSVSDEGEDARRRAKLPELHGLGFAPGTVDHVLEQFAGARLVTFDNDPETRTPTVEVAHEALLRRWGRLAGWIDEQREALVLQRRYRAAVAEWERAERSPEYLLAGGRLRQFESWRESTDLALTSAESEYLQASREREDAIIATRQSRRRLVGASLGLLALVALVFGIVAVIQRNEAADQRQVAEEQTVVARAEATRAEQEATNAEAAAGVALEAQADAVTQERIARARSLAGAAMTNLDTDPELAVLLAIEAVNTTRRFDGTVLRQAEEALHAAVGADRLVSSIPVEMHATSVAYDPAGSRYYVGGFLTGDVVAVPSSERVGSLAVPARPSSSLYSSGFIESNIGALAVAGPDDEWLVVAHYDPGVISVHDRDGLGMLFRLPDAGEVSDLAVSADGMTFASVSYITGKLIVWDLSARGPLAEFVLDCTTECPRGDMLTEKGGVALSDDGTMVTSGHTVWDVATGETLLTGLGSGVVPDVEFIDAVRIVLADGMVARVVDVGTAATLMTLRGHRAPIRTIDVSPDGRFVATGADDGLAMVWNVAGAEPLLVMTLPGHTGSVWEAAFSPDGRYLTTVGGREQLPYDLVYTWPRNWEARTWDVAELGIGEWFLAASQERQTAFLPDGDSIIVADADRGAAVWNIGTGTIAVPFDGLAATSTVTAVAASPDGNVVALGGTTAPGAASEAAAGWVAVFDPGTGAMLTELVPPTPGVLPSDLAFSASGDSLAAAAGTLARVWDTATRQVVFTPSDFARITRLSGNSLDIVSVPREADDVGVFVAVAFVDDDHLVVQYRPFPESFWLSPSATLWDATAGEAVADYDHMLDDGRGNLAVSPDGRMMIAAGTARPDVLELWTGRTLARIGGGSPGAVTAAFSPDGTRIATGEADGTVRLWDAVTADEQLVLTGHTGAAVDVAFSPDGTRLASVGRDGTTRVWALDLDELLGLAASRIDRDFTDAECRAYIGVGCPPAEAAERLIPATAQWEGLYGIDSADLAAAPAGGTWTEIPGFPGEISAEEVFTWDTVTVPDSDTGRIYFLNGGGDPSWSFDPWSGDWVRVAAMPPPDPNPDPLEPWSNVGNSVYVPGTGMIIAIRLNDGATMGYDVATNTWSAIAPSNGEFVGRYGARLVYDSASDKVVLFGGNQSGRTDEGFHVGLADTWIFDPATSRWAEVTPEQSPPGRAYHAVVYDAESDKIVVFGGATKFSGDTLDDTWSYNTATNTWTEMHPVPSPPARFGAYAWYDPAAGRTFVFGGSADWSSAPPLPWMVLGSEELWTYDLDADAWALYRTDANPGYRLWGTAAYQPASGEVFIFGGQTYGADRRFAGLAEDAWIYRHDATSN